MYTGRVARQKSDAGSRCSGTSSVAWTLSITAWSKPAAMPETISISSAMLAKPFIKVLPYICVILQMRIGPAYAIEFFALTRREFLLRIETPAPFEQALAPQYLMNARNTSLKIVHGIEDGGIRICDLLGEREQFAGDHVGMTLGEGEVRNGGLRPHRPMPKQTARDSERLSSEVKLCEQVVENVVIVSCVESDFLSAT